MTDSRGLKSALALAALDLQAPLVQDTLLEDRQFREEYGIEIDGVLSVGQTNTCFSCSVLCGAVRRALSSPGPEEATDMGGEEWKMENIAREGELPRLLLYGGTQRLQLPVEFVALSGNRETRLDLLERAASEVNLPRDALEYWHNILHERPVEDYEVEHLQADRLDTPEAMSRIMRMEIERGQGSPSTLAPGSRRYFERLVGKYDGSSSIGDYAAGSGKALFEGLSTWRPVEGLLLSLLLSSHSTLTDQISVEHLDRDDLLGVFQYLAEHGDRISQVGAIEVGLRILGSRPEIEEALCRLIEEVRKDEGNEQASGFRLLSALFWLVNGEVARMRLFPSEPPFYRRLAVLSQAALIYRQLVELRVDVNQFGEWARGRPQWHYLQSFTDMRLEPRWNPDYASEGQIKADFIGRILIAARRFESNVKGTRIWDLVLGNEADSLRSLSHPVYSFLPGPLEGAEGSEVHLPSDLLEKIEAELKAEEVGVSALISLGNLALIHRIEPGHAELAGGALKRGGYRLADIDDREQLVSVAYGLATVAAVARCPGLADDLRILCRRYRRDREYSLGIQEVLVICLVAAASRPGVEEWIEYVGDWLAELAFGELEDEEGKIVYAYLTGLCHIVPELWTYCGRAEAALKAFNER